MRCGGLLKIFLLIFFLTPIVVAYLYPEIGSLSSSACCLRSICGVECPTCGLTRGFIAASKGHLRDSFLLNPLSPVIFLVFLLLCVVLARDIILRRTFAERLYKRFDRYTGVAIASAVAFSFTLKWLMLR